MQNILFTENNNIPYEEIISDYTNFATQEEQLGLKNKDLHLIKSKKNTKFLAEEKALENNEILEYQSASNFNKEMKYSWLSGEQAFNISQKNQNFYLDSSRKEYIKIDFTTVDFGERPLYVPALKNNSIKSHTSQYVVRIQKATSLCENIKVHLQSSENVELNNLGDIHTFFISLVPEKIGDLKCLIFVNLKLKKKDNLQKEFEKIVYFDVKSKIVENQYKIQEIKNVLMNSDEIWSYSFFIFNPSFNKNLLIRECFTSNKNLKLEIGSDNNADYLNEDKKLVIKPHENKQVNILFHPPAIGNFNCSITIKTDSDHLMIPLKFNIFNRGVNFQKEFLDLGIIIHRMTAHKVPLIVINTSPKKYDVIDIIVSSKESVNFQIFFEKMQRKIAPCFQSNETKLGNIIIKPQSFDHNGYIEGSIYLLLNDTDWNPEEEYKKYSFLRISFGAAYFENLIYYDKTEFSAYIDNQAVNQPVSWPLHIKNNLFFPLIINSYTLNKDLILLNTFSPVIIKSNELKHIFHVSLSQNKRTESMTIFLNFLGYNLPLKFLIYDTSLLISMVISPLQMVSELCKVKCKNIFLDYGVFSSEEKRKKSILVQNINPLPMKLIIAEISIQFLSYEIIFLDKKVERTQNKKNSEINLPPYTKIEVVFTLKNSNGFNETFYIQFKAKLGENSNAFRIYGKYTTVNGNLIITTSNIRFQPGFPGLIHNRYVSIKSSFDIDCKVLEVESTDSRIIPYIFNNNIGANSRGEFLKLAFDPSVIQKDYRNARQNKLPSSLTYEDFFYWREYKQYWDNMADTGLSDIKSTITVKFNLIQNISFPVKAYLKSPLLSPEDTIDFSVKEINSINIKNITIINPSDKVMTAQLFLGIDEESFVNNNLEHYMNNMFRKSLENNQTLLCNNYDYYGGKKQNNWNFKSYAEYLNKKNVSEKIEQDNNINETPKISVKLVSLLYPFKVNLENEENKDYCNSTNFKRDFILKNNLITKEINEIKLLTEKEYTESESYISNFSLINKISQVLKNWSNFKSEKKTSSEVILEPNQTFFLEKKYVHNIFYIPPHSNLTIPALIFKPYKHKSLSTLSLYIKNNLTFLYPIKLRGIGGKGEIIVSETRLIINRETFEFSLAQKTAKENDKSSLNFYLHKEEAPFLNFFTQFSFLFNSSELPTKLTRYFKIKNVGNLPLHFQRMSIEQSGCSGYGFEIINCESFSLLPNQNYVLEIKFAPDFTMNKISRILSFYTDKDVYSLNLEAEIPEIRSSIEKFSMKFNKLNSNYKLIEIVSFLTLILFIKSLMKSSSYTKFMKNKTKGVWKLVEASELYELKDQNSVFSFENDIYELRRLRQVVKQSNTTKINNLLMDNSFLLESENKIEEKKGGLETKASFFEEQGNQGKQDQNDEKDIDPMKKYETSNLEEKEKVSKVSNKEKSKKSKKEEKRKINIRKEAALKKTKVKKEPINILLKPQTYQSETQIEDLNEKNVYESKISFNEEKEPENNEQIENILNEDKSIQNEESQEIQNLLCRTHRFSESQEGKSINEFDLFKGSMIDNPNTEENIENICLPEESLEKFEDKENPQSTQEKKLIERQEEEEKLAKNAELFDDAEQIIPAETKTQNIGIIGFPKKPKSDGEDSFYTSKSEKPKQYYDPFSQYGYGNPLKSETSAIFKKNTSSGLGLFTTNRENKYSLFSGNSPFYMEKNQEEEMEEELESNQKSYDERSDSEFSESSLSTFQKNKNNLADPNFSNMPYGYQCQEKSNEESSKQRLDSDLEENNENQVGSNYFRSFSLPQSNNPFSLSQLLSPSNVPIDPNFDLREKNLNPGAASFTIDSYQAFSGYRGSKQNRNYNFYGMEKEESGGNIIGGKRKPPPGFYPYKKFSFSLSMNSNNPAHKSTNDLYLDYEKSVELMLYYKKQLKIPPEKILEKDKDENSSDKPKISEVVWGANHYCTQIISIDDKGDLVHWDAFTNKVLTRISASKTSRLWLISADFEKTEGKKVACGAIDAKVRIFEINTVVKKKEKNIHKNMPIHELVGHQGSIQCCKFLSGNFLISGSSDAKVCVWDLESPQVYLSMHNDHTADVLCMATYENDSNIFLTGSADLTAKIWDIRVKQPVQATYKSHESVINTVQFFPHDSPTTFASGSDDSTVKLHDIRMKKELASFQDENSFESVYSIAFSKTGRFLFAGTDSPFLKVWDVLGDGKPFKNALKAEAKPDCTGLIKSVSMSSDGYSLAVAGPESDGIWILY